MECAASGEGAAGERPVREGNQKTLTSSVLCAERGSRLCDLASTTPVLGITIGLEVVLMVWDFLSSQFLDIKIIEIGNSALSLCNASGYGMSLTTQQYWKAGVSYMHFPLI